MEENFAENASTAKSSRSGDSSNRIQKKDSEVDSIRNKRFLADLQANLGNGSQKTIRIRKKRDNLNASDESTGINSISDAIQRINISDDDICASLVDVQPYLLRKADTFTEEEFFSLSDALCLAALHQSNIYFVIELCIKLIEYQMFQTSMSNSLISSTSKFLNNEGEKFDYLPDFLAQLIVAKWPRKFNKAVEGSNLIIFTVSNTVLGWVNFILTKTKEDIFDGENDAFFNHCVHGIVSFCNSGQRLIWLNSPQLYDSIYGVIVELLIGKLSIDRGTKQSLLQLYLQMNKWSLANTKKHSVMATQTTNPNY